MWGQRGRSQSFLLRVPVSRVVNQSCAIAPLAQLWLTSSRTARFRSSGSRHLAPPGKRRTAAIDGSRRAGRSSVVSGQPVLRVGCGMWAYKVWQGLHFPDHLARQDQLRVYASWCNAVEGNTTFYGLPAERTVAAWARESPEWFRFVFKLPKAMTNEQHLRDVAADHQALLRRLAPLGARA